MCVCVWGGGRRGGGSCLVKVPVDFDGSEERIFHVEGRSLGDVTLQPGNFSCTKNLKFEN